MKKYQKRFFCSLLLIIFFNLGLSGVFAIETTRDPLITGVDQDGSAYANQPLVLGLSPENSEVMVYLNGVYEGNAEVNREQTGTDNFYYQIKQDLNEGTHSVTVIAKDKTSLRLSNVSNEYHFSINSLPAPTLIQPDEKAITGKVKPFITGLTVNNTFVHLFIDGKYNGKTDYLQHESGTANFKYVPFLNLEPGWHTAWAKTEDASGRISGASNVLHFRIENPNPAPTILATVVNANTNANQPFIAGVAKNNSKIRVFVDKKLNGEFLVGAHVSGTAHFNYKPFLPLTEGRHMIYATAVDARGKESVWSNIFYFNVGQVASDQAVKGEEQDVKKETEQAQGEEVKKTDKPVVEKETEEKKDDAKADDAVDADAKEDKTASEEANQDIKDILNTDGNGTTTTEKGMVNESKEQQSKLKMNLVIFIIFLFMVIAWIFWVNRELIKERREQNEKDKDDHNLS